MKGRIYILDGSRLLPMEERDYDSESLLQGLLATHPDLLAGEQIDSDEPRRWLLVKREMRVPGEEGGAGRWSLDHLFLDQDGVPTLVEVKRSSDTRIRREVIGQMLDYAANAVAYWPVEDVRATFTSQCEVHGTDPDEEVLHFLGDGRDVAEFWQQVKTNLQAGRVRLVFVADVIPPELRRVVEFLNQQMDPAEVLAVEVRQFVGDELKTLVPRVIGQAEAARQKKKSPARSETEHIGEQEFLDDFDSERPEAERAVARRLIRWASAAGLQASFRRAKVRSRFVPVLSLRDRECSPLVVNSLGEVRLQLKQLGIHPPFDSSEARRELAERLKRFPQLSVKVAAMEGLPAVPIADLIDETAASDFLATLDWIVQRIRKH